MSTPLPPVPNVVKVAVEGTTSFLKNWFTLFHWFYTGGPPTTGDLLNIALAFAQEYASDFMGFAPPSTTETNAVATDLSTVMMPSINQPFIHAGTSTADKLPANCATLYNWETSMRFKGGHPRNYLYIGADENLLDESQWNSAYIHDATVAMQTFVANLTGLSFGGTHLVKPVMVSYFGGAPTIDGKSQRRAVPLVLDITNPAVNHIVGSQRRRLGRRA